MSGALLSTAFGAMQIIYTAYRDIKSNKEKCASLVQRAEFVVEELKLLVTRQPQEEGMADRIRALQAAFETTAQTIHEVGHKNWLKALLDADRDAIHVEHCHHCLNDLMFLFNVGEVFYQCATQNENERARKVDHQGLLQVAQSVQSELSTQGEIIGEVLEMVRTLSQSPTFGSPVYSTNQDHRSAGSPSSRPIAQECQPVAKEPGFSGKAKGGASTAVPQIQRRKSWMNKIGLQMIPVVRIPMPGIRAIPSNKARMMAKSHTKIAPDAGDEAGDEVFPECDRQWELGQFEKPQSTSPVVQLDHMQKVRYESRYVEVRYYPRDLACGVLLSEAFSSLGKTTLRGLRLASSHPPHPAKLSRLNEKNFVMEIPRNVDFTNILTISPYTNIQTPLPIVWVLQSCGIHLEHIKISSGQSHFGWALVPCSVDTLAQDVVKTIGELAHRKPIGCFRRKGHQTHRINQNQRLRDCGIGRGMYLEVEIEV